MSDDRNIQYNMQPQIQYVEGDDQGAFYYSMEESLADNMYNLAIESDNNDDDVDLTPTPSSRPPPEPFGINNFSEDDPDEMDNMTTLASISNMIEKHSTVYPDVKILLQELEPGFFNYGTIFFELEKLSCVVEDYLDENDFSSDDPDSSYTL
ncbi:uncharacterized protein LOC123668685 [Melitaea cinxia]|uniref:uncharacterized protein LOC123668685 n=1 Tax=Melitaea cinxia TaxID=113334 RepID=UPI001E272DCA|nr:uncharacterized protein LOC123668685 [Melitaea cinxia]